MRPANTKRIKDLLKEVRNVKELIWMALVRRTDTIRELTKQDEDSSLYMLANQIDRINTMSELYQSLLRKRLPSPEDKTWKREKRFTPYDRNTISLKEGLHEGLRKRLFNTN